MFCANIELCISVCIHVFVCIAYLCGCMFVCVGVGMTLGNGSVL